MSRGYTVFRKLDNGDELAVAWRETRKLAQQLIRDLMEMWPAEYFIRKAEPPIRCVPPHRGSKWVH